MGTCDSSSFSCFFFKQKTAYEIKCDWSSDVCSSDLGYMLLLVSSSVVVNPSLYEKVPYDVYKRLAPVTLAGSSTHIVVVHPSVPAKDVKELIASVQANPGKVSFASPGFGTTASLA